MLKVGLNLYSLHTFLKTEESFLEAANKLKQLGYSYAQYSGGEFDPDRIRRVSEQSGLPIVLTHAPLDRILNDTDALMQEHAQFGCRYIGLGELPQHCISDPVACQEMIETLNNIGEKMEKNGFRFFYHHHHFEFMRQGEKRIFDRIVEDAPHINLILDTYWLQYGGVDILSTIDRLKGRVACIHLKDYMIVPKEGEQAQWDPCFAPIGDGTLDFASIIAHAKQAGTEYFLVEQDNAADLPDPFEQVARSVRYLTTNF